MEKLKFNILINAPKQKVWNVLWDDKTYREWTAAFTEGSYAKSDWQEGGRIEFLDGKGAGMFSVIEKKIDNAQMTFKHLGEIKDGKDVLSSWGEARESYYLTDNNGQTELNVELDSVAEYEDYFKGVFPKALANIKRISE
jgi:Activator of Hsp90 ATPase homolog 1-like protein